MAIQHTVLALPFQPPFAWQTMLSFLAPRAVPGVERVRDDRYLRTFQQGPTRGVLEVRPAPGRPQLRVDLYADGPLRSEPMEPMLRRLFDLDTNSKEVDAHLSGAPQLARRVAAQPGIRVPRAWDPFELAVRAVLGQQVSVRAATTFATRLVGTLGEPLTVPSPYQDELPEPRLFPSPAALANANLTKIGLTRARAETLSKLAAAVTERPSLLAPDTALTESVQNLTALPGIGDWTAQYIAMRAFGERDAFPAGDLVLARALSPGAKRASTKELLALAAPFRPYRAYAAMRLWLQPE